MERLGFCPYGAFLKVEDLPAVSLLFCARRSSRVDEQFLREDHEMVDLGSLTVPESTTLPGTNMEVAPWKTIFHIKQVVFHFHVSSRENNV